MSSGDGGGIFRCVSSIGITLRDVNVVPTAVFLGGIIYYLEEPKHCQSLK